MPSSEGCGAGSVVGRPEALAANPARSDIFLARQYGESGVQRIHIRPTFVVGVPEQQRIALVASKLQARFEEQSLAAGISVIEVDEHRQDALVLDVLGAVAVRLEFLPGPVAQDLHRLAPVACGAARCSNPPVDGMN